MNADADRMKQKKSNFAEMNTHHSCYHCSYSDSWNQWLLQYGSIFSFQGQIWFSNSLQLKLPTKDSGKNSSLKKERSGVDKIIVKKQPYQLLNTSHEFFLSFQALNFHKLDD